MVRFGWKAGPEQYAPVELLEYAVAADQAGFEVLDTSDHFHPWSEEGQCPFTWTWLGAAAVQTRNIELGTGVTCPILRYHPSIIAQAAATVSQFAPGRTHLGIGTGEALNEFAATGQWPEYAERRDRVIEAIDLIRQLWSGESVSYEGKYYQTHKARTLHATSSNHSNLRLGPCSSQRRDGGNIWRRHVFCRWQTARHLQTNHEELQ